MLRSWITAIGVLGILGVAAVVAWAFGVFGLRKADGPVATATAQLEQAKTTDIDQTLQLIRTARDKFVDVKDYRAIFLRDETIDGELKQNHMIMKVRHEPFSVYLEWLGPASKKGRKTAYVEGQNNGKMLVREPLAGRFAVTLRFDVEESKKRGESKHTIKESGYKNLVERCVKGCEKEKQVGRNQIEIQDGELKVTVPEGEMKFPCKVVTTTHDPKDKELFSFYRNRLYFHLESGQLIRLEGYDWPKSADDKEGALLERYTYLKIEPNVGLKDDDFKL